MPFSPKFSIDKVVMVNVKRNQIKKGNTADPFDIPVEGSLGLLALGATGITEWRKVRDANKGEKTGEKKD